MNQNLGNHLHYSNAIAHGQSNASQVDKHDRHILTESESENLAKTSRIPHSSTATEVGEISGWGQICILSQTNDIHFVSYWCNVLVRNLARALICFQL